MAVIRLMKIPPIKNKQVRYKRILKGITAIVARVRLLKHQSKIRKGDF